jgi:beta-mannosidase
MQAYPSVKTLKTFASDNEMDMNSDVMRHRQRCRDEWEEIPGADGNDIILNYINKYYKAPKDFSSMVYLSQMVQAEAYKSALTSHRRNMPQCMGSLYWQFNDCWPTISWASLDYYFNWKASLYKVRDSNKPIILSFAKSTEKNIDLYIISDKLNTIIGALEIRLIDFDGKELWKIQKNVEIKSLKSEVIFQDLFKYLPEFDSKKTHLVARLFIKEELVSEDFFYFHLVKELILPEPEIIKEVEKTNNGYKVRISSNKLAKNIYLSMPDKEGHFSDNFFDLINGVMKVIVINTNEEYISETDIKIVSIKDTYN